MITLDFEIEKVNGISLVRVYNPTVEMPTNAKYRYIQALIGVDGSVRWIGSNALDAPVCDWETIGVDGVATETGHADDNRSKNRSGV